MNFASVQFIVFLLTVWAMFVAIPARFRWILLLVSSYVFYAFWSIPFILVILITTTIDYIASRQIHAAESQEMKRLVLWTAIISNLFVLAVFKYFNFFLETQSSLLPQLGMVTRLPKHMDIILPLGISYYTFEAISYVVDVYRGMAPAPSWWSYNFYIMYFPHLLSGPIVRFKELWTQYREPIQLPSADRLTRGVELILLGFFFKLAVADLLASVADPVFAHPGSASTLRIYAATLTFAAQLYMDFLGYTHIARGCSLLFNIELPLNFNHPLHATNMANFWQRWQISLSRWLADYVFTPLGGARKSLKMTMRNVFLTLFIAGIWHGAGWTYVILGTYFGCTVALYHAYRRIRKAVLKKNDRLVTENSMYIRLTTILTFSLTVVSAVLFRAQNVQTDVIFLTSLARVDLLFRDIFASIHVGNFSQIALCIIAVYVMRCGPWCVEQYQLLLAPKPYWLKLQAATAIAMVSWIASCAEVPPFVYFQF